MEYEIDLPVGAYVSIAGNRAIYAGDGKFRLNVGEFVLEGEKRDDGKPTQTDGVSRLVSSLIPPEEWRDRIVVSFKPDVAVKKEFQAAPGLKEFLDIVVSGVFKWQAMEARHLASIELSGLADLANVEPVTRTDSFQTGEEQKPSC